MSANKSKRLNVLVYGGTGASPNSVKQAISSLKQLLGANYAVLTVTGDQILKEPWTSNCALLVFPGGADLGYCRMFNGEGNRRIRQYVQMGGAYLGLCAGGYYGSAKCEFEVGRREMEVVGERELAFFPGTCRGLAFSGFVYQSEKGARAVKVVVKKGEFGGESAGVPDSFRSYYNGGGVFVDAAKMKDRAVEVLAEFDEELNVDGGQGKAAVVLCRVGDGKVMLTGPHPEFSGHNLSPTDPTGADDYPSIVEKIAGDDKDRQTFMRACLAKLGLEVSHEDDSVPSISPLHLSAAQPLEVSELVHSWHEAGIVTKTEDGEECIESENDKFSVRQARSRSLGRLGQRVDDALPAPLKTSTPSSLVSSARTSQSRENVKLQADSSSYNRLPNYESGAKRLITHEESIPDNEETPHFAHDAFFANLEHFHLKQHDSEHKYGRILLYGQVVTSTNTLLEKNPSWLSHLPVGFTATATTQVAGRGRGSNVWVSPPGSLMFSTVLRHALSLSNTAPVVFVQYLAALAIVAGIQGYDKGYEKLPVKLKWPNDIYALDPTTDPKDRIYVKVGGILVNSSYAGGDYTLVVGVGVNVNNSAPSVSLSQLAEGSGLAPLKLEKLLASVLAQFEALYTRFCRTGFDAHFESRYYDSWLHSDQVVTLETEGGAKARIKGITRDWGLLVAEELGWQERPTGRRWELQSDSNSFDFFKGLLKRKL